MSESLGTEFPKEQARVRECLAAYKEVGRPGAFASAMIEDLLKRADEAAIEGDVVKMLLLYKEMQEVST